MRTDRALQRPAGRARVTESGGPTGFSTSVWRFFAEPGRLLWLVAGAVTGGFVAAAVVRPEARADLAARAAQSPMFRRLYEFLDLHDPLHAWWMALLVGAAALSVAAAAIEHAGGLAFLFAGRRRSADPRPLPDEPVAAARRAAVALGPEARIGIGEAFATASVGSPLLRWGVALLVAGAAVTVGALWLERTGGVAGEVLLTPGELTDRVHVPGGLDGPDTAPLGFALQVGEVSPDALEAEVTLEGRALRLTGEQTVKGVRLTPRAARTVTGGEWFELRIEPAIGAARQVRVGSDDTLSLGEASLRVVEYAPDFRGLGPAVRLELTPASAPAELFWVFQREPGFDAINRGGDPAVVLTAVHPRRELIVAAVRHPGLWPAGAALALLLVGLALAAAGARTSRVVLIASGLATGSPADDGAVKAAIGQAARPETP